MLELWFTTGDLANVRFAFSPLWEAVASLRTLAAPDAVHRPWADQVRPRLPRGPELDAARALASTLPGFLAPPPATPMPDLDMELAVLSATPPGVVRASLNAMAGPRPTALDPLYLDPPAGLADLVDQVRAYWDVALAPYWPRVLTLLQGDVLHRARQLTAGGTRRLFADLDPRVRWQPDVLYVGTRTSRAVALDGRGLLLVPSVFAWPTVYAKLDPPWQPTLRYPPRGVGTLWWTSRESAASAGSAGSAAASARTDALGAVLGRSRARLLAALDAPASTTDLARRTGLSPGAVSQHLTGLRTAGLVSPHRSGRWVLYARTLAAETLLTAP
jgi:DNA-binding transcriptional ArsR family regulator